MGFPDSSQGVTGREDVWRQNRARTKVHKIGANKVEVSHQFYHSQDGVPVSNLWYVVMFLPLMFHATAATAAVLHCQTSGQSVRFGDSTQLLKRPLDPVKVSRVSRAEFFFGPLALTYQYASVPGEVKKSIWLDMMRYLFANLSILSCIHAFVLSPPMYFVVTPVRSRPSRSWPRIRWSWPLPSWHDKSMGKGRIIPSHGRRLSQIVKLPLAYLAL